VGAQCFDEYASPPATNAQEVTTAFPLGDVYNFVFQMVAKNTSGTVLEIGPEFEANWDNAFVSLNLEPRVELLSNGDEVHAFVACIDRTPPDGDSYFAEILIDELGGALSPTSSSTNEKFTHRSLTNIFNYQLLGTFAPGTYTFRARAKFADNATGLVFTYGPYATGTITIV
jgi:hypothetical protein